MFEFLKDKKFWLLLGILILIVSGISYFYLGQERISFITFIAGILSIFLSLYQLHQDYQGRKINEDIINDYKIRYEEQLNKAKKLTGEKEKTAFENSELKKFLDKINETLQEENISKEELIEEIDTPLRSLILVKTSEDISNKRYILRGKTLPELGFKHLDKGIYLLPPKKTPNVKSREDLENWIKMKFKDYVNDDYEYAIQLATPIDLRKTFYERNLPPYRKKGKTVLDVFSADELIPTNQIIKFLNDKKNISSRDIIELPNIRFLVEDYFIERNDLEILKSSNDKILDEIKKALKIEEIKTTDLATVEKGLLSNILKKYNVSEPEKIAERIKDNATFWKSYFEHRL